MTTELLWIMVLSAVPVLEQKAAIPLALSLGYSDVLVYFVTLIGAIIPAPFIMLFIPKVFEFLKRFDKLGRLVEWYEKSAMKRGKNIVKYELLGLLMFVAFPLPLTGVWTGSAVAAMLKLDFKKAFPTVILGAMICGLILMLVFKGAVSLFWIHG
ncbi:MAG: ligand-binding protein SH3 [Firmicutes bacterium HGW-Firmicutes-2]|jgi:uncharacterized membrane protein|nr:MAG: ligand-binding protein SH3 [Firmicutes bacterium HGW-Firmicutes-2]